MNNKNMESFGYTDFYQQQVDRLNLEDKDLVPARVTEVHREQYKIVTVHGEKGAKLKGSIFYNGRSDVTYPAVGDFALVQHNPLGDDIIYHVLERKSKFSRLDSFYQTEQIVATNFDYVFIMTSLNHDFNVKRTERYLASAWQSGAKPVIVLTKTDICDDYSTYITELESIAIGVPIIAVSSHTGEGIEQLREYIRPNETIVFLGSSGVGKSSLVNAIAGEDLMKVSEIREADSKGRHTTTHRQLIVLPNGTMIIDTPGMRELGVWNVSEGLDATFSEIEEFASRCRFTDCSHHREPGCGIMAALESGELSQERWDNYIKLQKEARFAQRKEKINAMLQEKSRHKSISKNIRQSKKGVNW